MSEPTIYEVAKEAGVSAATVSRAINGRDRISETTRQKVFDACAKLGFSASKTASMLRTGKTNRIALTVGNSLAGWFSSQLAEGVYSVLASQGYDLLSYRLANADQRRDFFSSMPVKRNADAVIISSFDISETERRTLEQRYASHRCQHHRAYGTARYDFHRRRRNYSNATNRSSARRTGTSQYRLYLQAARQ